MGCIGVEFIGKGSSKGVNGWLHVGYFSTFAVYPANHTSVPTEAKTWMI